MQTTQLHTSLVFYRHLGCQELPGCEEWSHTTMATCPLCENHRLCIILHFQKDTDSGAEAAPTIRTNNSVRKMQTVLKFCTELGIKGMDLSSPFWLFWLREKLKRHRPHVLMSKRVKNIARNRSCWVTVDFFQPNK